MKTPIISTKMSRYFLDTHIVGWLLSDSPKLDEELRYDIEYPSGNQYVISEFVLLELLHLKQLGKIQITGNARDILSSIETLNIGLEPITDKVFEVLDEIPILTIGNDRHSDMIDRIIIAQSIADKCTLISHDRKFPYYRPYGLMLN